jgi:hypothetical protein
VTSDKAKHVDIQVTSGSDVTTLRFVANSRDVSDAIIEKVESSRLVATAGSSTSVADVPDPVNTEAKKSHRNGASVRFAKSPDSVILNPENEDEEGPDGEQASALYDFQAQASDELSVKEGETLIVVNREESEEWWKCRNMKGEEGVVPSSYVEVGQVLYLFDIQVQANFGNRLGRALLLLVPKLRTTRMILLQRWLLPRLRSNKLPRWQRKDAWIRSKNGKKPSVGPPTRRDESVSRNVQRRKPGLRSSSGSSNKDLRTKSE